MNPPPNPDPNSNLNPNLFVLSSTVSPPALLPSCASAQPTHHQWAHQHHCDAVSTHCSLTHCTHCTTCSFCIPASTPLPDCSGNHHCNACPPLPDGAGNHHCNACPRLPDGSGSYEPAGDSSWLLPARGTLCLLINHPLILSQQYYCPLCTLNTPMQSCLSCAAPFQYTPTPPSPTASLQQLPYSCYPVLPLPSLLICLPYRDLTSRLGLGSGLPPLPRPYQPYTPSSQRLLPP